MRHIRFFLCLLPSVSPISRENECEEYDGICEGFPDANRPFHFEMNSVATGALPEGKRCLGDPAALPQLRLPPYQ
jgi:hypothetical protein